MAGLVPAICRGTMSPLMAGTDPRIESEDGHDGESTAPSGTLRVTLQPGALLPWLM